MREPRLYGRAHVIALVGAAALVVGARAVDGRASEDAGSAAVDVVARGSAPPAHAPLVEPEPASYTVVLPREVTLPRELLRHARRLARDETHATYAMTKEGLALARERALPVERATPGVARALRDPTFAQRARRARDARGRPRFVDGLKDEALVEAALHALARAHPKRAALIEVGRSREGRAILGLQIASDLEDRTRPAVLLVAGHHADEIITPEAPLDAARALLEERGDPRLARLLRAFTVVVVPLVNPDGSHMFWHVRDDLGRTNLRRDDDAIRHDLAIFGVDLNRNYPTAFGVVEDRYNSGDPRSRFYRGPAPASEPETASMIALAHAWRFVAAVSYHAAATRILVPYTVVGRADPEPSAAWSVARLLVESVPDALDGKRYEAVRSLYPVSGTDQDFAYATFGTLAYLVELPVREPDESASLDDVIHRSRPIWMTLMERYLDGPSLEVEYRGDARGVDIAIDEVTWKNGERFFVDEETGLYRTYLAKAGPHTVRARRGDVELARVVVDVRRGVTRVVLGEPPSDTLAAE